MKICPYCAEEVKDAALKCKHCQSWIGTPPAAAGRGPNWFSGPTMPRGRLYRSRDRMVLGVCSGLADYFGIDPTWVRLGWAIAAVLGGVGVVLYIIFAMVVPEEPESAKGHGSAQDLP